jgi:hypothetical protein
MPQRSLGTPHITGATPDELRQSVQFWMQQIFNHVDQLTGARGTPKLLADVNANSHNIINLPAPSDQPVDDLDSMAAVPRKFATPLVRQPDGSFAWDCRFIPMMNDTYASDPTGVPPLQQVLDLINNAIALLGNITGTFTITGTGFTVNPTATARYVSLGNVVILFLPELTGTSNATTFTLTGLPATIVPTQTSNHIVTITDGQSGATDGYGLLRLSGGSATITMISPVTSDGSWTATGTKTLYATSLTYARW